MASEMLLGSYTFVVNPSECSVIKANKVIDIQRTYQGVFAFNWGNIWVGQEIKMKWDYMPMVQFNDMDYMLETYGTLAFLPNDDSGYSFLVWIKSFTGDYHITHTVLENVENWRKNVELVLIIQSKTG